MKKYLTIELEETDYKDFVRFCDINGYDESKKLKQCFTKGYNIEKYGLLSEPESKIIEKEIITEKIIEKPIEIIKEVPVEVIVEKEIIINNEDEKNDLLTKMNNYIIQIEERDQKIENLENTLKKNDKLQDSVLLQQRIIRETKEKIEFLQEELNKCQNNTGGGATFLRSSNLKY
jgi:hypothetical protein